MSEGQRRRARRRRRVVKGFKRTFINIVFAPTRIPKIKGDTVDLLMRLCESAALAFVALLVMHIALPDVVRTGIVVVVGIAFAVLLGLIKLSDYQRRIEQYRYYGFSI